MRQVKIEQNFFLVNDGQELFYRHFQISKPKGTVVLVHGIGEHCSRYDDFSNFLASQGFEVYLYDQRGHGKTPGLRSYAESISALVNDLFEFAKWVKGKINHQNFYLMGHSFGGQVAVNFLSAHPKLFKGAILSSPNIELAMEVPWLKRFLGSLISQVLPSLSIPNDVNPKLLSHDPEIVQAYQKDRLVQRKITLRLGNEILENLKLMPALAEDVKVPIFIFHGSEDKITSPQGSKNFYDLLKVKDRIFKLYRGFFHETLNEVGKKEVYQDVVDWLNKRSKK